MAKKRNKRMRKKLHLGEFKEMGFAYETTLKFPLAEEVSSDLMETFLSEVIEPRDLALGGWLTSGYIARAGRGTALNEDRIAVETWLMSRPEFQTVRIGPLQDVWYE